MPLCLRTWFGNVKVLETEGETSSVSILDDLKKRCYSISLPKIHGLASTHLYLFFLTEENVLCFRIDAIMDLPFIATLSRSSPDFLVFRPSTEDFVVSVKNDNSFSHVLDRLPAGNDVLITSTDRRLFLADSRDGSTRLYKIFDEDTFNLRESGAVLLQMPESCVIKQMAAGYDHVLLLSAAGRVYALGTGNHGELGVGQMSSECEPVAVDLPDDIVVVEIAAAGWHSLARTNSNDVYVWGWNHQKQLGDNLDDCVYMPTPLDIDDVVSISAYGSCTELFIKPNNGEQKRLKFGKEFSLESEI